MRERLRLVQTLCSLMLAAGALLGAGGAANIAGRYNALSHQMMCTCGCAQLLGECNHVGCPNSPGMLARLRADLSGGMGDHAILASFAQNYGPESLASPLLTRFNQAAWVMPPAVLFVGLLGAVLLLRRARDAGRSTMMAAPALTPAQADALARVRRETGEA